MAANKHTRPGLPGPGPAPVPVPKKKKG